MRKKRGVAWSGRTQIGHRSGISSDKFAGKLAKCNLARCVEKRLIFFEETLPVVVSVIVFIQSFHLATIFTPRIRPLTFVTVPINEIKINKSKSTEASISVNYRVADGEKNRTSIVWFLFRSVNCSPPIYSSIWKKREEKKTKKTASEAIGAGKHSSPLINVRYEGEGLLRACQ